MAIASKSGVCAKRLKLTHAGFLKANQMVSIDQQPIRLHHLIICQLGSRIYETFGAPKIADCTLGCNVKALGYVSGDYRHGFYDLC